MCCQADKDVYLEKSGRRADMVDGHRSVRFGFDGTRRAQGQAEFVTSGQFDTRFCITANWGAQRQYAIDSGFTLRSFPEETRLRELLRTLLAR